MKTTEAITEAKNKEPTNYADYQIELSAFRILQADEKLMDGKLLISDLWHGFEKPEGYRELEEGETIQNEKQAYYWYDYSIAQSNLIWKGFEKDKLRNDCYKYRELYVEFGLDEIRVYIAGRPNITITHRRHLPMIVDIYNSRIDKPDIMVDGFHQFEEEVEAEIYYESQLINLELTDAYLNKLTKN